MSLLRLSFLSIVFFLSGAAGLLYQVMWMKELGLLFGSTSQSAAVTTAAFFLGLGLGAQYISRWVKGRAKDSENTQQFYFTCYALLEVAIGLSALLYFLIYPVFTALYGGIFAVLSDNSSLLLLVKLLLAIGLLTVPAFFMGGTLPVMAELVKPDPSTFSRHIAGIYFINTLGACFGAMAGGFWLPREYGFTRTYLVAVSLSLSLAAFSWLYRRHVRQAPGAAAANPVAMSGKAKLPFYVLGVAAFSGFASLALQVMWTRLFAQVLQNSTYTYSAILVVFLFALTLGALIAKTLSAVRSPLTALSTSLSISALLIALTPFSFMFFTNQMSYVGGRTDLYDYLLDVIGLVAVVIGPSIVAMGVSLPLLYKVVQANVGDRYAETVGRINSLNTYAAILGSLMAGFLLFHWLGTWHAIYSIALLYMLTAITLAGKHKTGRVGRMGFAAFSVAVVFLNPAKLPVVPVDPIVKKEHLLAVWEGNAGTVAVVERDGNRKTKLNNWYALGGSKAKQMEAMQTHLPVNLHGNPQSVFYLGLGTGITAGTILDYPVKRVVVAELIEEVITASELYFSEFNNGLFEDKRVSVVNEDGRHYLSATAETFDLVIADLFIPWRAGVGSLYSFEHYQSAINRINEGGMYVQWLPLYQISETEYAVIAKTMGEVFPMVTVWRGDFFANKPVVALIGHRSEGQLATQTGFRQASKRAISRYKERGQVPLMSHYIGQVNATSSALTAVPVNTDDMPIIEFQAPASHRAEKQGLINWLTGADMLKVFRSLQDPEDTYLEGLSEREVRAIYAGYFLQAAQVAKELEDEQGKAAAMGQFNALMAD